MYNERRVRWNHVSREMKDADQDRTEKYFWIWDLSRTLWDVRHQAELSISEMKAAG